MAGRSRVFETLRECGGHSADIVLLMPLLGQRIVWAALTLLCIVVASRAVASAARESLALRSAIPELDDCRQLLVVTSRDWDAVAAQMRCFQRASGRSGWTEVWPPADAVLGRTGFAWGRGLHGTVKTGGPVKREGDGKAPAGVFRVVEAFGFASVEDAKIQRLPYRQLTAHTEGIDDPASRHYNRLVEGRSVAAKDWTSSERMRSIEPYRWGAVVGHNWDQVPGGGSCIFLHVWEGAGVPTSGCTAMPESQMLRVLRWLDERKNPILVQLPVDEYRRVRAAWKLP